MKSKNLQINFFSLKTTNTFYFDYTNLVNNTKNTYRVFFF